MKRASTDVSKKVKSRSSRFFLYYVLPLIIMLVYVPVRRTLKAGHPLSYIYPNLILFFPGYGLYLSKLWPRVLQYPTEKIEPVPIPVIQAKDYSMELVQKLSDNFRQPVVVKGLFKDSPASTKWTEPGYLASKIGEYKVRAINLKKTFPSLQNNRTIMPFKDAMYEILSNRESFLYLFFPIYSRSYKEHNKEDIEPIELVEAVKELVLEDLELDTRIAPGYGTPSDKAYKGAQLLIGRGHKDQKETTGTGWHCSAGSNWFIQVIGTKRWFFLDSKWGVYLSLLRGGTTHFVTGSYDSPKIQDYLPVKYVELEAGDMLYNPDFQLHTILNKEGLSIGVATRDFHLKRSIRNNLQLILIVAMNTFAERILGVRLDEMKKGQKFEEEIKEHRKHFERAED
eukprot:CAMPEP_0118698934 /NCGR_PEP_ID=MMETSP0800-20121206/15540_1 /TAXON_ID=210618 ORGANISM="Striatella unipunctata, Strain CCMP2910" /NCGR_SAMPLE_ID=MMETSP0800 /ASSEMBLY_ACC=CAM_ASM_000638 /LENGTH=396 /DNA_ID=CAMNT_0006598937 /DNA_START=52 /DNA_END=1242 /DNA_ORIENTATION=+